MPRQPRFIGSGGALHVTQHGNKCEPTFELGVLLFERVGDVLQEQEAKDDVLVLGGVHATPQCIGHLLELGFVAAFRKEMVGELRSRRPWRAAEGHRTRQ